MRWKFFDTFKAICDICEISENKIYLSIIYVLNKINNW